MLRLIYLKQKKNAPRIKVDMEGVAYSELHFDVVQDSELTTELACVML